MIVFKLLLHKIPTDNRFYALHILFFASVFVASPSQAGMPLTEADTIEQVIRQTSVQNWIEGSLSEAQSVITGVSHWDNPVFSYALDLPGKRNQNALENSYMLSQKIDLSGRRGLQQSAAKLHLQSVVAANQSRLALFKAETRLRFFDVLHRQQRIKVIDTWTKRLAELQQIIAKRESAGDVSGYDLRRLQRETASAVARQQTEAALLQQSWERLLALWENHGTVDKKQGVSGELLPATPTPLQQLLATLEQSPELRSLAHQKSALDLNTKAAERWMIPTFNLGVGAKTYDAPSYSDTGLLVTVDVPLPLWSQNNAERVRFRAQTQKAESEYQLAYQKTQGEIRALWQQLSGLLQAVKTFKQQGQSVSNELIGIAVSSYQGGEIGILELLDAYRERQSYQLELLGLIYKARQANIELDRLTAGINP